MDSGYISSRIRGSLKREREQSAVRASRTNRRSVSSQTILEYFAIRESGDRGKFLRQPLESEIRSGMPFDYRVQKCFYANFPKPRSPRS